MAFLDDIFESEVTVEADFRNKTTTMSGGVPTTTYSTNSDLTVEGLFWTGAQADKVVSEKIRPDVTGVFVFNYSDYTTTIKENAKVIINGKEYSVIYLENIGNQNEIMQVPVKEFK